MLKSIVLFMWHHEIYFKIRSHVCLADYSANSCYHTVKNLFMHFTETLYISNVGKLVMPLVHTVDHPGRYIEYRPY